MMPAVRSVLEHQYPEAARRGASPVGILRPDHIADITGDGISEAFVTFGTGGASTSPLTLMRIEDGKPVVALFKDRHGKIQSIGFLEGASVMHTDTVEMLPKAHAVFYLHYQYRANGPLGSCDGESYRWDSRSKTFNYDARLSRELTRDACSKVPQSNRD